MPAENLLAERRVIARSSHTNGTISAGSRYEVKTASTICLKWICIELSIEEGDTSAMKNAHWLGRALLLGFVWIFVFAIAYVLLDAFGLWQRLPATLAQAIDVLTGAVL